MRRSAKHCPVTISSVTASAPPGRSPWTPSLRRCGPGSPRSARTGGGFYSYSVLERAVGADIHNAAVIHPEWQQLEVGDTVWLARRGGDRGRQIVAAVVPCSHLVLMSTEDYERIQHGEKASGSWSFHLRPVGDRTRLLARGNAGYSGNPVYDIAHFVMERKMLLGIRRRVHAHRRVTAS